MLNGPKNKNCSNLDDFLKKPIFVSGPEAYISAELDKSMSFLHSVVNPEQPLSR